MPIITWSDSLSVQVKEFDGQHQKLVQLLNDVYDAVTAKKSNETLKKVIGELIEYTKYHFSTEEKYMDTYDYPQRSEHIQEHTDLTNQVLDFHNKFIAGKAVVDLLLMNFLKDWLTKHILGSDKKYGLYLNTKGVS
ncbi:MAG: hemerythrin family protein [Nitrospirae bacterium]|nr:hemerythrin family protein [Nitrospirota bacterium]